jgi:aryl-alcohol dehydrogenase-like predicted oxidoreductase
VIDTASADERVSSGAPSARRRVHLFTKGGHAGGWGRADWRPPALLSGIEQSLRRLATDYLDLVQLHSCSLAELKRGDAIEGLERARERGWVRYIGYSGDGQAARYAVESGRFDTLQTSVSIADQEAIDLTLPLAQQRQMGVIAKRPLANAAWRYASKPAETYHHAYWSRLRALDYPFLRDPRSVAYRARHPRRAGVHTRSGTTSRSAGSRTRPCRRALRPPTSNARALALGGRSRGPDGVGSLHHRRRTRCWQSG